MSKLLPQNEGPAAGARAELKRQLRGDCIANIGKSDMQVRANIESIIADLVPLNPTTDTATSPLLMKKWDL